MTGTCVIVGAGEVDVPEIKIEAKDFVIGADGGMEHLERLGIKADMALGDFDSLGYVPEHQNLVLHPVMKDDTDMMLAAKEGMKLGYRKFRLYGGLGGRLDHTLANIQTLIYLSKRGAEVRLIGDGICVTAVTDGEISFDETYRGVISIFCLNGKASGVTLWGLKYPLENAELKRERQYAVSNEFLPGVSEATVTVEKGALLIITSCP